MKIVIIGPGALGSLFAAQLAALETHDVWFLDRDPERAKRLNGKLLLTVGGQEFCRKVSASADPADIGSADLLLLCVKSRNVAAALDSTLPLFSSSSILICFQNGIGHLDILKKFKLPVEPVIGVTSMGATLIKPGHVCHGGHGLTRIGFLGQVAFTEQQKLDVMAGLLTDARLPALRVSNILDFVWAKLLINAGINALTVIFNCPNGQLPNNPEAKKMLAAAVLEGQSVAKALGIHVAEDPVGQTLAVCTATAGNISSMLQDVRRGRPTEIGAINGALLAKAEELGMDLPVNRDLVDRVKEIEAGYLRTEPRRYCPDCP